MTSEFVERLSAALEVFSLKLSEFQMQQFYTYYEMLIDKNKVMNLTAITELDEVITKHFVDSLSLVLAVKDLQEKPFKVIDVGTGAGFPGIPLKIVFPKLQVTLLDSLNKRVVFLEEVIKELKLDQIVGIHGRAEEYGHQAVYREQFDFCVSRAVANLSTLSEYCLPFVMVGGSFIPYKSGKIQDEVTEAKHAVYLVGGKIGETCTFQLPGTDAERTLIQIRKESPTGKKYPRKAGLPSKEPLK